jgi:hypothetical protein
MRLRGACYRLVLLAAVIGTCSPSPASAQALSTFDDFSSGQIDGSRWAGYAHTVRFADLVALEGGWNNAVENPSLRHPRFSTFNGNSLRRILGGQLQLLLGSMGGIHPNPNVTAGHGRLGVVARASTQNVVQARVTAMAAEAPACRSIGESRVRAQLVMDLHTNAVSGGGVFATLSLDRRSFAGDRIYAVLSRCRDSQCLVAEDIDWVIFSRTWTVGGAHTLTIRHQPVNNRVVFTVAGGGVAAERRVLRSGPPSEGTELASGFGLRVETTPANCPAVGDAPTERNSVTIDARFDNVRVGAP